MSYFLFYFVWPNTMSHAVHPGQSEALRQTRLAPTNGLVLCKNHHWAMDRDIIAHGPDLHWHVAKAIDPRRSNGERELHELHELQGKCLLLPKDPTFHPGGVSLEWRLKTLTA